MNYYSLIPGKPFLVLGYSSGVFSPSYYYMLNIMFLISPSNSAVLKNAYGADFNDVIDFSFYLNFPL